MENQGQILSSLPLQIFVFFHWYYLFGFTVVEVALLIYKGNRYYYPSGTIAWDYVMLVLGLLIDSIRLSYISRGNKMERSEPLMKAFLLSIVNLVCFVWFLELQTYVLFVEVLINAMGIFFVSVEIGFSLITASRISMCGLS